MIHISKALKELQEKLEAMRKDKAEGAQDAQRADERAQLDAEAKRATSPVFWVN